jgi:hypothetical protein
MKIFNAIECKEFNICFGYASPGEVVRHPNTLPNNTQNQFYLVDGSVSVTNGTTTINLPYKQWQDLSQFKNEKVLTYTVGNDGCSWVIILPKNAADEYTITEVSDGAVNAEANSGLLVTEGETVVMNNTTLKPLNYVPLTKTVNVIKNNGVVHKLTKN